MSPRTSHWPAAAFCLALSACGGGSHPQLQPTPRATAAPEQPGAFRAADNGVELVAQPNAWAHDAELSRELVPIRVWIRNDSASAVRIRYDDFKLMAADGSHYAALPPLDPERLSSARPSRSAIAEPEFIHSGFLVAPHYAYAYPGLSAYDGPYDYELGYYRRYRERAAALRQSREAQRFAIPEGVLDAGGALQGFLYFEPVQPSDDEKGLIRLTADLEAVNASELANLSIPFALVER